MHANAAMGTGSIFDPAGVETVIGFELTPVRHRGTPEFPTAGETRQIGALDRVPLVRKSVGICTVVAVLVEDLVRSLGSW